MKSFTSLFGKGVSLLSFTALTAVFAIGLQACGGSSSGNFVPTVSDVNGLYKGSATVNGNTTLADVRGFVHAGRFIFFNETEKVLYDGNITEITEDTFTGTVTVYLNGTVDSTTTVSGNYTSESSITTTLAGTGYGAGSFNLTFDLLYNRSSDIAKLGDSSGFVGAGHLDYYDNLGFQSDQTNNSFLIQSVGFNGVSTEVCDYIGTTSIPDTTKNIYLISHFSEESLNCKYIDTVNKFTGFLTVVDDNGLEQTILYASSNGTYANFSIMVP